MPNKPTTLREEWNRRFEDAKFMEFDKENWDLIGDFWLYQFSAHSTELLSKIEGMKFIRPDQSYPIGEYERIRNETIDQVINLINQNK